MNIEERAKKWQRHTDMLQYGTLGGLFATIFILEAVSKQTARIIVWPLAATILILATISFFVSLKADKYRKAWMEETIERHDTKRPKTT
jgi:hypothetical protein